MSIVADIINYAEQKTRQPLGPDEGVHHGSARAEIDRVVVSWMATPEVLRETARRKAQLLICHESLYFPYDAIFRTDIPKDWPEWKANRRRRELLENNGINCLRIHGTMDKLTIFDDFAEQVGMKEPVFADELLKVYEIPERPLRELIEQVKRGVGMQHLRVAAPNGLDVKVGRIGLPWGGLGLSTNIQYSQHLIELKCDVLVAGESDNYGFRFAVESGLPMIETSHEASENRGVRHFARMLQEDFPNLDVQYVEVPKVWQWQ